VDWARSFKQRPEHTFVVHGEPDSAQMLANQLRLDLGFPEVTIPSLGQVVEV